MPTTAIIGKGLVGTAAARALAEAGQAVILIGPDEPTGEAISSAEVYASHYDQARVQRQLGFNADWTSYHLDSIAQYADLQKRSGIRFHYPVGCLYVCPDGMDEYLHYAETGASEAHIPHTWFHGAEELQQAFPEFQFATEAIGYYEPAPSGYLNPRALVAANYKLMLEAGGKHLNAVVRAVQPKGNAYELHLSSGEQLVVDKVVVATGSFANFNELLPMPLPLVVKGETVILARLSDAAAASLAHLPALLYEIVRPELDGIYMLPPVQYPDGAYYAKIGMNMPSDQYFTTLGEAQEWFRHGDSQAQHEQLKQAFLDFLPTLPAESWHTQRCIISRTPGKQPLVTNMDGNGWYSAITCNGYSAMSAMAFGEQVKQLVLAQG